MQIKQTWRLSTHREIVCRDQDPNEQRRDLRCALLRNYSKDQTELRIDFRGKNFHQVGYPEE